MKQPGPDHPITISPQGRRVVVTFAGHLAFYPARVDRIDELDA